MNVALIEEVKAWQSRPLDSVYPIVYLDCIHVKVRDSGVVKAKAVYLAIGIDMTGNKEVLSLYGTPAQQAQWLPRLATGEMIASFALTEPGAGSDAASLRTTAIRDGDDYVVTGQKIWTSRYSHSHMYLLIARTTPFEEVTKKTEGLSLFLVDIAKAGDSLKAKPIRTMINHHTFEVFIDNLEVTDDDRIGEEGKGFYYLLDSLHSERLLVASEAIGDGKWFVEKASRYASERVVFDRPIGANQGVQFPIARAHMNIEAAELMRNKAATLFDAGLPCGREATMVKYLASEAAWEAAQSIGLPVVVKPYDGNHGRGVSLDLRTEADRTVVNRCTATNGPLRRFGDIFASRRREDGDTTDLTKFNILLQL